MSQQHNLETDDSAIPAALRRFVAMRLMELSGVLLLAAAGLLALSLATWSALDPSLNRALDGPVRNWLGWPGAIVSDELMSQLGLAVIAAVAVPVAWAGRLMSHVPFSRPLRRIGWWLGLMLAGAAFAACFPAPSGWPLAAGLGGNLGGLAAHGLITLLNFAMKPLASVIFAAIVLFILMVTALLKALGIGSADIIASARVLGERNQDRIAAGFGGVSHWRLGISAFLQRRRAARARRRALARMEEEDAHETPRPAPRVRRAQTSAAPATPARDASHAPEAESAPPVAAFAARAAEPEEAHEPPAGLFRRITSRLPHAAAITPAREEPAPGARMEPRLVAAPAASAAPASAESEADAGIDPGEDFITHAPLRVGQPLDDAYMPEELPDEDELEAAGEASAAAPARRAAPRRKPAPKRRKKTAIKLPPLDILAEPDHSELPPEMSDAALEENARILEGVLEDFGVKGQIINVCPGPVVTLYELEPAPGIKSSRVIGLADDIARSMCAISARVAVVPGRNVIGIELPNSHRETVYLREMLESPAYKRSKSKLPIALGKNIGGEPVFADLARMPHLLIAGTTGSGKSVGINTFIMSLLYKLKPEQCRLIMIDPKMLELSIYEGIPHLLSPVVTDPKKAVVALKWAVREMEDRYQKMAKLGVRNLDGYNARVKEAIKNGEVITRTIQTGFDPDTGEPVFEEKEMELEVLPWIVIIIDEMADLMMVGGKDIEGAVQGLAQIARAAGIHVVMATQRPSVDVITGTIKANFPTRISFQVTSKIDSRTILGEQGAEQLLGMGDMLYMAGGGRIVRLHGPFVSDDEVEHVVKHLKSQAEPDYVEAVIKEADDGAPGASGGAGGGAVGNSGNELYDKAVQVVLRDKKVSTSYIQRRLQIGYNKAATLIERMEAEGLISAPNSKGRREILVGGDSAN